MPRVGAWHARLRCERTPGLTGTLRGAVTIRCGATTLRGTAYRGSADAETDSACIVAGAGGLRTVVPPRYYRDVPLRIVLSDICADAGETVAASSSASALGVHLRTWARPEGPAGDALRALVEAAGVSWRMTDEGHVWVGEDTWPEVALELGDVIEREGQADGVLEVWTETARWRPGTVVDGQRVGLVVQRVGRAELWAVAEGSTSRDRLAGALRSVVRAAVTQRPLAWYRGRVVSQSGQTVDVRLDDASMPGLARVQLWHGLPGVQVQVPAGLGVLVAFAGDGWSTPVAALWEPGESVDQIQIAGGTARVAREGDSVDIGQLTVSMVGPNPALQFTPIGGGPPSAPSSSVTLSGAVSSGTSKVLA